MELPPPRKSPLSVSYKDLVKMAQVVQKERQGRYDGAKARGTTNLNALVHQVECAKALVRILKKCEPGKQADLFELFQQVNK